MIGHCPMIGWRVGVGAGHPDRGGCNCCCCRCDQTTHKARRWHRCHLDKPPVGPAAVQTCWAPTLNPSMPMTGHPTAQTLSPSNPTNKPSAHLCPVESKIGWSVGLRMTFKAKGLPGLSKGWCTAYSIRTRALLPSSSSGPGLCVGMAAHAVALCWFETHRW